MSPWDRLGRIVSCVNAEIGETSVVFLSDFNYRMSEFVTENERPVKDRRCNYSGME